jgi:hypothetical protein
MTVSTKVWKNSYSFKRCDSVNVIEPLCQFYIIYLNHLLQMPHVFY